MKKSTYILFVALILALFSFYMLTKKVQKKSDEIQSVPSAKTGETEHILSSNLGTVKRLTPSANIMMDTNILASDQFHQAELQKLKAFLEAGNISQFYWGKVVDQDGVPLAGVKIHLDENQNAIAMHTVNRPRCSKNREGIPG